MKVLKGILTATLLISFQNASAMTININAQLSDSNILEIKIKNYIPGGSPWCGSQTFYATSIDMPSYGKSHYEFSKSNFPNNAEHYCVQFRIPGIKTMNAIVSATMIDACQMNVNQYLGMTYISNGTRGGGTYLYFPEANINDHHTCFY